MNLGETITLYQLQLGANGRSVHSLAQAQRHMRRFTKWLGDSDAPGVDRDVTSIDPTLVARFFTSDAARLSAHGGMKKPSSVNALRASLRAFFRFLHDAGYVQTDPTRLLQRARCGSRPPRAISPADEAKLIATIDADVRDSARRDGVLVRLLARTGLRISSALAIEITDLDNDAIEIRESKGDQRDRIPVSRETIQMLLSYVGTRTQGPIFLGRNGKALDRRHFARRLADWSRKAGLRRSVHPHQFRHGLALRLLDAGHDLRTVQQALRHRSIASTMQYTNVPDMRVSNALRDLETAS